MKISIVGPLIETVDKKDFTVAIVKHVPNLATMPKGLPRSSPQETTYMVYIGKKQWNKVKDIIHNPEDKAIIEGIPMWDGENQVLSVFTTSITTKLLVQAKKEAQRAKSLAARAAATKPAAVATKPAAVATEPAPAATED